MNNTPLISIIVPIYNVGPYLEQCLNSIISQTYKHIEILCVNNNSTDNSLEIAQKFAQDDTRIKILNCAEQGLSSTRNTGIDASSGEYIAFIDSDDWISPLYTELLLLNIQEQKSDISCCDYYLFNQKKMRLSDSSHENNDNIWLQKSKYKNNEILASLHDISSFAFNKLYKASIIKQNKLYFPAGLAHEDILFNFSYYVNMQTMSFIAERLYYYRVGRENSLMSLYQHNSPDVVQIAYKIIEKAKEYNVFDQFKVSIYQQIVYALNLPIRKKYNFNFKFYKQAHVILQQIDDQLIVNSKMLLLKKSFTLFTIRYKIINCVWFLSILKITAKKLRQMLRYLR